VPQRLVALPTGVGEPRGMPRGPIDRYEWGSWLPDGRVLAAASVPGGRTRFWVQDFPTGAPRLASDEGIRANFGNLAVAPDGRHVAALDSDQRIRLYAVDRGGQGTPLTASRPGEAPIQWSADGRALYVFDTIDVPAQVWRLDVATGERRPWKSLFPADPAGVLGVTRIRMTPDASAYVYTFSRILSDLYLVQGLE
jgi:dipeptidyl aminopeptidase/acylaminoacyl peptidase